MTDRKSGDIPGIDEVRAGLEDWRQTRRGKARIPDDLWSAAIAVARRDASTRRLRHCVWMAES